MLHLEPTHPLPRRGNRPRLSLPFLESFRDDPLHTDPVPIDATSATASTIAAAVTFLSDPRWANWSTLKLSEYTGGSYGTEGVEENRKYVCIRPFPLTLIISRRLTLVVGFQVQRVTVGFQVQRGREGKRQVSINKYRRRSSSALRAHSPVLLYVLLRYPPQLRVVPTACELCKRSF